MTDSFTDSSAPLPTEISQGGSDWRAEIPRDLQMEPSLARIKDVGGLAKSYVEAQRMIGAEKIPLPREGDNASYEAFYQRLGRPESPDKYVFKTGYGAPTGEADKSFQQAIAPVLHRAGLNQRQVDILTEGWNQYVGNAGQIEQQHVQMRGNAEIAELEREWGAAMPERVGMARRGAVAAGFNDAHALNELEKKMGTGAFLRHFAKIGELIGEDTVIHGNAKPFASTPQQARTEIARLNADPQYVAALMDKGHPNHENATAKRADLYRAAYPDAA